MENTPVEMTQADMEKLTINNNKYLAILAKSRKYKADNREYTLKYNREYMAKKMEDPDFRKKHNEAQSRSSKKRREIKNLQNPQPTKTGTNFTTEDIKTLPDNV